LFVVREHQDGRGDEQPDRHLFQMAEEEVGNVASVWREVTT